MTDVDTPGPLPAGPPRQRFPTKKQALLIFFGSIVLSFTTCTTVLVVFGERQLGEVGGFLVGLAVYVSVFAPVVGLVVLFAYFARRRAARRESRKGAL